MTISALFLLSLLGPADGITQTDWQPAQTQVVIAGVLKWEKNSLSSFSDRHRKDKELADVLRKRGVPAENLTLLLDDQATKQKILAALQERAKAGKRGSTFLFYYCGHGWVDAQEGTCLANYDCRAKNNLSVKEIGETLTTHFPGQRVIFLADCCHSGGLKTAGAMLSQKGKEAVVLTSADSTIVSTANWTFTQTIIDALRGDPLMDHNGDGVITLQEIAQEVANAMRYRERQRHGYATFGINPEYRVVRTDLSKPRPPVTKGAFAVGDYVLAPDGTKLRPARIVQRTKKNYVVEFYHYSDKVQATVAEEQLQKIPGPKTYAVGTSLAVLWEGKPYLAKVLKVEKDLHHVTYPGWSSEWDEWVPEDRILGEYKLKEPLQLIEVKWHGKWYKAVALDAKEGKQYIRYIEDDDSWNEWVPPERVRKLKGH